MDQIGRFPSLVSTSLALLTVALLVGGCQDRYYDFGVRVVAPDGAVVEVGRPDGFSFDTQPNSGGRGGSSGSAGKGGSGGSAGKGGSGATGGGGPACSNSSPERLIRWLFTSCWA